MPIAAAVASKHAMASYIDAGEDAFALELNSGSDVIAELDALGVGAVIGVRVETDPGNWCVATSTWVDEPELGGKFLFSSTIETSHGYIPAGAEVRVYFVLTAAQLLRLQLPIPYAHMFDEPMTHLVTDNQAGTVYVTVHRPNPGADYQLVVSDDVRPGFFCYFSQVPQAPEHQMRPTTLQFPAGAKVNHTQWAVSDAPVYELGGDGQTLYSGGTRNLMVCVGDNEFWLPATYHSAAVA